MKKSLNLIILLLFTCLNISAQKIMKITGNVTDNNGEPLIGVSVVIKNQKGLGTVTDINGDFNINVTQYQTLEFSYIGFKSKEILVKDQSTINIKMEIEDSNILNEVIVTGLGAQKKLTVTGAITNVDVGQMKLYSSSNFTNTIAGNVPGIIAMQSSGQPGKNTSRFWIRGISTFGVSSDALILVDGFERSNINDINIEDIESKLRENFHYDYCRKLGQLKKIKLFILTGNPDIESFSVLKDASATAIYGSKGANGVILITTKRGKEGKININAKVETSYNTRTITPQFVDGYSYAKLLNEARVTRNIAPQFQPEELALIQTGLDPDFYPNTNWSKLLLKDGAQSYRTDISLSGGGPTARYFASAAYIEDQGMYKTDKTRKITIPMLTINDGTIV